MREVDKRPIRNDRLRRAREERNLTQADVARIVRTSTLTVSRWELGVQTPLPHYREQLCRLYGSTAHQLGLLPGADEAESPPVAPAWPDDDPDEERARRDLLGQVRRYWIGTELQDATGELPSLQLALVERPDAVDDPLSVSDRARRDGRHLPRGAGIREVHRAMGEQLLILGGPGAGKTTLLLQLARELLGDPDRRPTDPMPVVFHLASWTSEGRPFADWLVDELHKRYGVARWLARRWIESDQVLPLLDGLDEVADRRRVACVVAINQFRGEHGQLPMAVCCRTLRYEESGVRLRLRGAVAILPLSPEDVRRYLSDGEELGEVRALADDEQLRDLLATPLFLKIAAIAYRDRSASAVAADTTLEARRRRVLGDYVDAMLARSNAPLPPERTVGWLRWLARGMRAHDQSVFYLDHLQPSWLPDGVQRWLVTRGIAIGIGLVSGAMVGINWGTDWGLSLGPSMFALIGVTTGLLVAVFHAMVASESRIVPAQRLHWSWAALRAGLPRWVGFGLAIGVACGILFGLVLGLALEARPDAFSGPRSAGAPGAPRGTLTLATSLLTGVASGVLTGVTLGLLIALAFGLLTGLDTRFDVTRLTLGRSVEASGRTALIGGVVGALVFGLGFALFYGVGTSLTGAAIHHAAGAAGLDRVYWPVAAPNDIVVAGLMGGVVAGMQRGGGAYLRHRALLTLLTRAGCAPRDYRAFLEYAARLVLLRRRGSGYEFMHGMLLEHFADLPHRDGSG